MKQESDKFFTDWVTIEEASEITGYSRDIFYKLNQRQRITSARRGNMIFLKRDDVIAYAEKMKKLGTEKHSLRYAINQKGA